jgi:hypothetical protein
MSNARLELEHESVRRTLALTDLAWLAHTTPDLLHYRLIYEVRTLVKDPAGLVREAEIEVGASFHLHPDHPRVAPLVVIERSGIFHPNCHDPARGDPPFAAVCLGEFPAQRRLGDWALALFEVLAWQRVGTAHGLNAEAAAYACTRGPSPVDPRPFVRARRPRGSAAPGAGTQEAGETACLRFLSQWRSL